MIKTVSGNIALNNVAIAASNGAFNCSMPYRDLLSEVASQAEMQFWSRIPYDLKRHLSGEEDYDAFHVQTTGTVALNKSDGSIHVQTTGTVALNKSDGSIVELTDDPDAVALYTTWATLRRMMG